MKARDFALFADNDIGVVLSDSDLACSACQGTGEHPDPADPAFGIRIEGCPDCQGTGQVLPPHDMSGAPRTLDDIDEQDDLEREGTNG